MWDLWNRYQSYMKEQEERADRYGEEPFILSFDEYVDAWEVFNQTY